MRYAVTVRPGGKRPATGSASFTRVSPDAYRRLRRGRPAVATQADGAPVGLHALRRTRRPVPDRSGLGETAGRVTPVRVSGVQDANAVFTAGAVLSTPALRTRPQT